MGVKGELSLNHLTLLEVDADPTVDPVSAEIGSLAITDTGRVWVKTGTGDSDWQKLSPQRKSGRLQSGDFSGTPKTAAVVFAHPYPDNNYEVTLGCSTSLRSLSYESKTQFGFTINTNANAALVGEVSWCAFYDDETA